MSIKTYPLRYSEPFSFSYDNRGVRFPLSAMETTKIKDGKLSQNNSLNGWKNDNWIKVLNSSALIYFRTHASRNCERKILINELSEIVLAFSCLCLNKAMTLKESCTQASYWCCFSSCHRHNPRMTPILWVYHIFESYKNYPKINFQSPPSFRMTNCRCCWFAVESCLLLIS